MAQRISGYPKQPNDNYSTPSWCVDALLNHEDFIDPIWEPAPGEGKMVEAIRSHHFAVHSTDSNFLEIEHDAFSIITNPPFSLAEEFCRHALENTVKFEGKVAMLLPAYFDNAKTRKDLFLNAPFKIKYVLTDRIRWTNLEQKRNGPSTNHSWFVWDWKVKQEPRIWWI